MITTYCVMESSSHEWLMANAICHGRFTNEAQAFACLMYLQTNSSTERFSRLYVEAEIIHDTFDEWKQERE